MMAWEDVSRELTFCCATLTLLVDGFFDAGMLLQALKKKNEQQPAEQIAQRRRAVGKKLALTEY